MAEALERSALARWQRQPIQFVREVLRNPETGRPFDLLDAEVAFLDHAYQTDEHGKLIYPEQVYACPKKSGKSAFGAMHLLTTTLVFGGRFAEGYALANDLEQAQGRVFQAARRICEASPYLEREANITQSRIEFPETGAVIQAIGSDYAGAAGGNPTISVFDELWAYSTERSRRLFDEMVPPPTRKIAARLVVSYAGFENESTLLLELYKRGLRQPLIGADLHGGDGLLMFWSHRPIAPWQDERWLADMRRTLRANQYQRMIECRFVTSESTFIDMALWDQCVDPQIRHMISDRASRCWAAVDASTKHDSTALALVIWSQQYQHVRLCDHRIFIPTGQRPIEFAASVEQTLLDWHKRFNLRACWYDPYQMASSAQRLLRHGVRMVEFPQTIPNLTAMGENLFELIKGRNMLVYADDQIRSAVARAVAVEGARGWKISKEKQSHRIDIVIALGMATLAAVRAQSESQYDINVLSS